jgi:hypothetical protein
MIMAEDSKAIQSMPPFPALKWNGSFWRGRIKLGSWQGFQARLGAYAGQNSSSPSDGTVRVSVTAPGHVDEQPPSAPQAKAVQFLLDNEEAIRNSLVAAIFEEYPTIRERLLGFADESDLPAITQPDDLKGLIGLSTIHVLQVVKDDAAYLGFEFGCSWDDEHGLGMMTHQGRIVELPDMGIGKVTEADLASEEWLAEEDAETSS